VYPLISRSSNQNSVLDRVLYTPERLAKIAVEAAKQEGTSVFSLNDRIGLVHDAMALSKAGLAKLSSAMTLVDGLKGERECE
jgi:aminopeptidase 2